MSFILIAEGRIQALFLFAALYFNGLQICFNILSISVAFLDN